MSLPFGAAEALALLFPGISVEQVQQLAPQFNPKAVKACAAALKRGRRVALGNDDEGDVDDSRNRRRIELPFICDAAGHVVDLDEDLRKFLSSFFVEAPVQEQKEEQPPQDLPVHQRDNVFDYEELILGPMENLSVNDVGPVFANGDNPEPSSPDDTPEPSSPEINPASPDDDMDTTVSEVEVVHVEPASEEPQEEPKEPQLPVVIDADDAVSEANSDADWHLVYPRNRREVVTAPSTEVSGSDVSSSDSDEEPPRVEPSPELPPGPSRLVPQGGDNDDEMKEDGDQISGSDGEYSEEYEDEDDDDDDDEEDEETVVEDGDLQRELNDLVEPVATSRKPRLSRRQPASDSTSDDGTAPRPRRRREPKIPAIRDVQLEKKKCMVSLWSGLFVYVLVVGQMQSGKGHSMPLIACAMLQKKQTVKRFICVLADQNEQWKRDTQNDFKNRGFVNKSSWKADPSHKDGGYYTELASCVYVWHLGDLQTALLYPPSFFKDAVVFWDEVQVGSRKGGLLGKCFTAWGLRDFDQMKENNTALIGFSATPEDIAVCFSEMPAAHAKIMQLPMNQERYYGLRKMIERGMLQEAFQIVHYKPESKSRRVDVQGTNAAVRRYVKGLLSLTESRQDETGNGDARFWHLLRPESCDTVTEDNTSAKNLVVELIRQEIVRLGLSDTWDVSPHDYRNKERDRSLRTMPAKHTILVITHFYGKANRLYEQHLLTMFEYTADRHDSSIAQSLAGRGCGMDKLGQTFIFSNIDAALRYLRWAESGFSLQGIEYRGSFVSATPNGGMELKRMKKNADPVDCSACVDEVDRPGLDEDVKEEIKAKRRPLLQAHKEWVKGHRVRKPRKVAEPAKVDSNGLIICSIDLDDLLQPGIDVSDSKDCWATMKDAVLSLHEEEKRFKSVKIEKLREALKRDLVAESVSFLEEELDGYQGEARDSQIKKLNCYCMHPVAGAPPQMVVVAPPVDLPGGRSTYEFKGKIKGGAIGESVVPGCTLTTWDFDPERMCPTGEINLEAMATGDVKVFIGHDRLRVLEAGPGQKVPHRAGWGNRPPVLLVVYRA